LEDSGWYQVDYSKADYLDYGRDNGCGFFAETCTELEDFIEFCTVEDEWGCDLAGDKKASCMSNEFSNNCMYWNTNFARTEENTKCVPVQSDGWNGGAKFDFFLDYECNEEGTEISFKF